MHRILVTNDDGVYASGLQAAAKSVRDLGEVIVAAPSGQMTEWGGRFPSSSRCAMWKLT